MLIVRCLTNYIPMISQCQHLLLSKYEMDIILIEDDKCRKAEEEIIYHG